MGGPFARAGLGTLPKVGIIRLEVKLTLRKVSGSQPSEGFWDYSEDFYKPSQGTGPKPFRRLLVVKRKVWDFEFLTYN